jgi:hypothetical protein
MPQRMARALKTARLRSSAAADVSKTAHSFFTAITERLARSTFVAVSIALW